MEELKALIGMVNQLPQLALWVLVGFWAYKVICVGSIYGVIRFIVGSFVKWKSAPIQYVFKNKTLDEDVLHELEIQVSRLSQVRAHNYYNIISRYDVEWLRDAIDQRIAERDRENREKKEGLSTVGSGGASGAAAGQGYFS